MSRAQITRNNVLNKRLRTSKIFRGVVAVMSTALVTPVTFGASWLIGNIAGFSMPIWAAFLMAAPVGVAYLVIGSED